VGKSTLLNLITDRLTPETGEVDVGVNTNFGYFDQHSQSFDLDLSFQTTEFLIEQHSFKKHAVSSLNND